MVDGYRSGLAWLAHSGIQAESGGVSRYLIGNPHRYRDTSTEITAYSILGYLYLPLPGHTGLLSNALRAGQFLCYDAGDPKNGLFPFELPLSGFPPSNLVYFFDCGIIIRALLALWNTTGDRMYLERAEGCGAALMSKMSRVDGSFFPLFDLSTGTPFTGGDQWSLQPGVHQLKVGMAFMELAEVTSSGLFSRTAEDLLQSCLRQHEMFLPGAMEEDRVADRLHPYCYFLEGLLPFVERRFDCAQVLQAGLSRVENFSASTRATLDRCDVVAQLLRLRLIADYMGIAELDVSAAAEAAERLPDFQLHSSDRRTNGAYSFGFRNGELLCHANPVSTVFALQAIRMWSDYKTGELRTTWRELI